MPKREGFILVGVGGLFILIGLVVLLRGRRVEKRYYNSLSARADVREYLEHSPEHPEFSALKIGGWITIAVGIAMLTLGGAFLLWG